MRARESTGRLWLAAAAISAVWILLNARKPVHTDDAFTLYWARAIAPLPGERVVPNVNWIKFEETLVSETQHYSSGWALTLATARRLLGEREAALHWLQWPFATLFLAGCALLARGFGAPPWACLALCATSPAFLIPSASLLGDMPAAGLGVAGLALWRAAPTLAGRLAAVLLLALAGQMKQSALVLYPLLLLDPAGRFIAKPRAWILPALTLLLAGWYPDTAPHDPERRSIAGHVLFILHTWWLPALVHARVSYLLATLGGVLLTPVAFAFALAARRDPPAPQERAKFLVLGALAIPALAALGLWKARLLGGVNLAAVPASLGTLWWYAVIGVLVAWGLLACRPGRAGAPRYLLAWLALNALGFVAANPTPAVRHLLPSLPPLALLYLVDLRRHCSRRAARIGLVLAAAANAWLGLSLARNDYAFAAWCRDAAARGAGLAAERRLPLITTGSWGLRFYTERAGGRILERSTDTLPHGALLLAPRRTDHRVLPAPLRRRSRLLATLACPPPSWPLLFLPAQTVPPPRTVSAFHGGHLWFPYAFSRSPLEEVDVLVIAP